MGSPTGFLDHQRKEASKRPVEERICDHREVEERLSDEDLRQQAGRCMECGIPFCHASGCPLANRVPDWNDLASKGKWREALASLHSTNNFPEITGRVCPALCEAACTLSLGHGAVFIREIELEIVERGWENGWIVPEPAARKSGRRVAVVGSGPAGLTAAQQLSRMGHAVTVFEKSEEPGGLLRFGIPEFKLEKRIIERRLTQMREEGVSFETGVDAGRDLSAAYLRRSFDALLITAGAGVPRDLQVPGRNLQGVHFALDFLYRQNRINAGAERDCSSSLDAKGKNVVVIGGGDTGADCIGTARRQGAGEITQIEILPEPPAERMPSNPWPSWPNILRSSSSHQEGCRRMWAVGTKEFLAKDGRIGGLSCVKLEWPSKAPPPGASPREIAGSGFEIRAELAILALGFLRVESGPLVKDLGLALDGRGNIAVDRDFMCSAKGVFAAGDCVSGASLVVRAMNQGRAAAAGVDRFLGA